MRGAHFSAPSLRTPRSITRFMRSLQRSALLPTGPGLSAPEALSDARPHEWTAIFDFDDGPDMGLAVSKVSAAPTYEGGVSNRHPVRPCDLSCETMEGPGPDRLHEVRFPPCPNTSSIMNSSPLRLPARESFQVPRAAHEDDGRSDLVTRVDLVAADRIDLAMGVGRPSFYRRQHRTDKLESRHLKDVHRPVRAVANARWVAFVSVVEIPATALLDT